MLSPVPEFIAAVIPTTRSSRLHSSTSALPNTLVYCGAPGGRRERPHHTPLATLPTVGYGATGVKVRQDPTDVGGVQHAVVVEDDHDRRPEPAGVVHGLECDAAGHRAVADHSHHAAVASV